MAVKKFFESKDADGDAVFVENSVIDGEEVYVKTSTDGSYVSKEQAPALALAVLEAAGYTVDHSEPIEEAIIGLRAHLTAQAAKSEKEALLVEAKALYEGCPTMAEPVGWDLISDRGRDWWRSVAQKARELHAAKEESK